MEYQKTKKPLDTSITEVGGRRILVNNQTGEIIRDLGASGGGGVVGDTLANRLNAVGIPPSVATTKGQLEQGYVDKMLDVKLLPSVIEGIWQNITAGNTFEDIRQGIRAQGGDPAILDTFIQILQGGGESGTKSKLDSILDKI